MSIRLGLDIGATSIGWAIIDQENQKILNMGVRVFPAGVNDYDTNKESSKNETRRMARGLRRQYVRRRWRKIKLLEFLIKHEMTPVTNQDLTSWKNQRDQPTLPHLVDWFMLDPYALRKDALNRKLTRYELGRVLYHIIQRRGFLSNRKSGTSEESTIDTGKADTGTVGISATREALSDYPTLGSYLANLDTLKERIRNRYTSRSMYVDEVKQILDKQSEFYDFINEDFKHELLGDDTKKNMNSVLFYQRPLKSQKHTLGRCTFEPGKTRCPMSSLEFEEFRIFQWINSIEYQGDKLSTDRRQLIAEYLFGISGRKKFKDIKKHLKFPILEDRFNYKDDDNVPVAPMSSGLRKAFGTQIWKKFSLEKQHRIWHDIYAANDNEWLTNRFKEYGLGEEAIKNILKIDIKRDYSSLSFKAINNILPFLKAGYVYNDAVLLAGVKNVFADAWESHPDKETITDTVFSFRGSSVDGTLIQQIKNYLSSAYNLSEQKLKKLYHHSQLDHSIEMLDRLPIPDPIKNPIVSQAIYEVRGLVNRIIDEYGKFDAVHIELARDLKKSTDDRQRIKREQRVNEERNNEASDLIKSYGGEDTYFNRLKVKLYNELREKKCPYTGKTIHIGPSSGNGIGLFTGQVQIEHIIPYTKSLNNSFGNLTLCDADENRKKSNLTPYEYYASPEIWEEVKMRAKDILPYFKFNHFKRKDIPDDIAERLLNDTRYMSREVHRYLKMICNDVVVVTGSLTADLRHHWALNSLISEDDNKNRKDHRHHAIDALVVALTDRATVNRMSKWNKFNKVESKRSVDSPWEDLRSQAEIMINQILVSHKKTSRVVTERVVKTKKHGKVYRNLGRSARGQLHKETVYGKRISPETGTEAYHVRKSLKDGITSRKHISKIVDPVIRRLLIECLGELGIDGEKIPPGTFVYENNNGQLQTRIHLVSKHGKEIPVLKVRIKENLERAVELKDDFGQYVNPRNNHHVAIYVDEHDQFEEDCVTFWDVVERRKQGLPTIAPFSSSGKRLLTTLQTNDMFLIGWNGDPDQISSTSRNDLIHYLYRVQKLSSLYYVFRGHLQATLDETEGSFVRIQSLKAWHEKNPMKVWITPDGQIQPYKT